MGKNSIERERIGDLVTIFLRGRMWYANYQHRGRQRRKSLQTTSLKEARRRAQRLELELGDGSYREPVRPAALEQGVEDYLRHVQTEDRKPDTVNKYRRILERAKELARELGRATVLEIDLQFMDEYRSRRREAGCAPKTIYNEATVIRQLVNFALTRRLIREDPLNGIKLKKPKPRPQPCWSPEKVELILDTSREPQRTAYTILAETGMRIGELRWLTWDDVDLANNVLHIRPKEGWRPKSGDQRVIPVSTRLRRLLAELPHRTQWVLTAPPSRHYPRGDHQISGRRLLAALKRVLERLTLKGHLHTFRHSFISWALLRGTPEAVVRKWVGHVDRDVLKLYTHVIDTESQAAMRRLSTARPEQDQPADQEK